MLKFLKRKTRQVQSPVDGEVVEIESVNDEVFSQKLVGDGVAIIPMSNQFKAPIDGVISKIFSTNHAYSIKSSKDMEVMVHIGLETVNLEGKGFTRIASEGDKVKAGDVIIEVDLAYIKEHAKDIITPILILEDSDVKHIDKKLNIVKAGDIIMEAN